MHHPVHFPTGTCRLSDDWSYKDLPVVFLENDYLKIGILVGRGSDIFEFTYKPGAVDLMLRLPKGIQHPGKVFSQDRSTANQFEDYYYGGWQEILPNSPAFRYRGASLGQHGEVSLTPWKHAIVQDGPQSVAVRLWTQPLRVPVRVEKTLTLHAGDPTLYLSETLTNTAGTPLDIAWGHHVAFGLPFLAEGAVIRTNARWFEAEQMMPPHRRFRPGIRTAFPAAFACDGSPDDVSVVPPADAPPYSEMGYLWEFPDKRAWYALENPRKGLGFSLTWDADVFRYLWYWQERYGTRDAPWWGNTYAVALEPWSIRWQPDPEAAIRRGEWLQLAPGASCETSLEAAVYPIEIPGGQPLAKPFKPIRS